MASASAWGMFDYPGNQSARDVSMEEDTHSHRDVCLPHFNCLGKVNANDHSFHPGGYVISSEFDSLLNSRVPHAGFLEDEESIQLFNHSFIFEEAFLSDHSILLNFAKSCYERIEHAAKSSQTSTNSSLKSMKQSLIEFLAYTRTFVHRFLSVFGHEDSYETFFSKLENTIEQASLWLSSMSDIPSIIFSGGSLNNDSSLATLLHVHFDIKWSLVETCYMAANLRKYSESCRTYRERFAEISTKLQESLCADLMYLSLRRFVELNPTELPGVSPFNCTCIRELWFMLLTMLKSSDASVFALIQRTFQNASTSSNNSYYHTLKDMKAVQLPTKDPLAVVWLITHLAKLSGYNTTGVWDKNFQRIEPAYDVINRLVQMYTSGVECPPSEDRSKGLIGCLYSLSHIWGSNLNLCINLWEFFSRKVDENFSTPSAFEPVPYSSSVSWFENLSSNLEPWKSPVSKHNSYLLFLKLLGHHLETMNPKNQASMKARLFVKLQGKKMQDLSPTGVYHMLSACLTVVLAIDSPDMSSKVLELSSDATKHKLVFFSAEMALLLVLLNRKRDCKDVCVSVSNYLEKISRGLKDGEVRDEQRKLGAIFVEALQETVAQSRNLAIGQSKLIDGALRNYLKNCGSCDRASIIEALTSLLRKLKSNATPGDESMANIMAHIYPLMKDKFCDVDHVFFFTELAMVSLETSQLSEFQSMFTHFCLDEKVDPKFSLCYLSQLLQNKQFTMNLSLSLDNYQTILIQSWFKISYLLPRTVEYQEQIETVNGVVKRLPKMAELTVHSKITPNKGEMILDFLLVLSASLQNVQNFNERTSVKENYLQYLGPLDRYLTCGSVTSSWDPPEQINHVIRLTANLFFHCGNIIYTKGKADCLLVLLTNVLLTPISFSDLNKDLPSSVSTSFQQHLPMFVFGLTRLNPARDPYVVRSLSSVFQTFMTRYQPNLTHPFTRCWMGLENEPITESLVPHVRSWFLQTISNNVLPQRVARTSPYLAPTLQWLKILVTNQEWRLDIVRGVMLSILELSLILDEIPGKKSVTDFLQVAICDQEPAQMKLAEEALNELVSRQLAFNSNRLFKLIEVVSFLNNDLVKRVLPNIKNQVAITEAKRGTGTDSTLRQHLKTLEISLG